MTVQIVRGDIFDSPCAVWVNPVNCVGVMGKGLAKGFKERFPGMFEEYAYFCQQQRMEPGDTLLWNSPFTTTPTHVICLATKDHWRDLSQLAWIQRGVRHLATLMEAIKADSVALPALGCGEGGLRWEDVKKVVMRELDGRGFATDLYKPQGEDYNENQPRTFTQEGINYMDGPMVINIRELQEFRFAMDYAEQYHHGTDGHGRLMLLAKCARQLGFRRGSAEIPETVIVDDAATARVQSTS